MSKIIIGITGATGIQYGVRTLEILKDCEVETHLIVSNAAEKVMSYETDFSKEKLYSLADKVHPVENVGASIASGSFKTDGMIITPCSIKTLSEIATGVTSTLLTRAADVVLKERRRLVLMVRETPLHAGHLKNMLSLTEMGGIIMPPVPSFYTQPATVDEIISHTVIRALDLFGLNCKMPRWGEEK
ncbi:MAG: UbiX family flavin prenyltransferase [Tannerellaceae bacterium]|nr:UbiX family flavin prenyltransferase [Tannerellaceae bacterium]